MIQIIKIHLWTRLVATDGNVCSNITKLLVPTHAHFHWLKFIKNI